MNNHVVRRTAHVVALEVVVCACMAGFGPMAAAAPSANDHTGLAAQSATDRIQRLIDEGKLNLPDGVVIERIPDDARDLGVVYNDGHRTSGVIAAVSGVEAIVHLNSYDSGFAFFMNFQPTSGAAFPGAFLSDNLGLGGGFNPGDLISSYDVKIFRSSRDPASNLLADVHLELWDGDPLALVDTVGGGFSNAPIPGSAVTFSGIAVGTTGTLRAALDPPVIAPNGVVWVTITGNSCRLGWSLSFITPSIGSAGPDLFARGRDLNGVGSCCDTGEPCNVSQGVTCADDADGSAQMCSDGDAESASLSFFGGPCTGFDSADTCATFVNTVRAPAKVTISLVPVSNGPKGELDPGVTVVGDEMTLPTGGGTVFLEARISDWDLVDNQCVSGANLGTSCAVDSECGKACTDTGVICDTDADCSFNNCQLVTCGSSLQTFNWRLDDLGLSSAVQGTLAPKETPCTTDADCIAAFGGACDLTGEQCTSDDECTLFPGQACLGMDGRCLNFPGPLCNAGFIIPSRLDYVFHGENTIEAMDNVFGPLSARWGAVILSGVLRETPDPFPPDGLYAGTYVVDVSPDAAGTFTLGMLQSGQTHLSGLNGILTPLLGIIPAKISITDRLGRCCVDDGFMASCIDGITMELCDSTPFSHEFVLGGRCDDPGVECALPAVLGRCCTDDRNVAMCIDDVTKETCDNTPFSHEFVARGSCNAPGVTCELPPLFGRCCVDDGPSSTCMEGITRAECDAMPFSRGYVPGGTCAAGNVQCLRPPRNRYLSVSVGEAGVEQAVRVTFSALPAPFDTLNGTSMWVGLPFPISENGHNAAPALGFDSFMSARLQCDPVFMDWTAVGTVEVFHENIVPDGAYTVEVFDSAAPLTPANTPALELVTSRWGDIAGAFDPTSSVWTPPDGSVDLPVDIIAAITTFGSRPNFARKVRIDVVPSTLDGAVDISDIVAVIDAFSGKPYRFEPTAAPCP